MATKLQPKCKQCRRAGEKLFLKGEKCLTVKCPIVRRAYPPGIHGPNQQRRRMSEFGIQLREKQKAKAMYRMSEKQFVNYYQAAVKSAANSGEELLRLLERRLDNVVFRLGLTTSRDQARQLVTHGHVLLNGRRIDVPSYSVKKGDVIAVLPRSQKFTIITESLGKRGQEDRPDWLAFEPKELSATIVAEPASEALQIGIDAKLIIEYYSR